MIPKRRQAHPSTPRPRPLSSERCSLCGRSDRELSLDAKIGIGIASAALGAALIYLVYVAGEIAQSGEPGRLDVGAMILGVLAALRDLGRWTLGFQLGHNPFEADEKRSGKGRDQSIRDQEG